LEGAELGKSSEKKRGMGGGREIESGGSGKGGVKKACGSYWGRRRMWEERPMSNTVGTQKSRNVTGTGNLKRRLKRKNIKRPQVFLQRDTPTRGLRNFPVPKKKGSKE